MTDGAVKRLAQSNKLLLGARDLDIWCVRLFATAKYDCWFEKMLSTEERDRVRSFREAKVRKMFTLAHGVLHALLGRYLGVGASAVSFKYGVHNKPSLETCNSTLQFNMSRSDDLAVYAFASDCQLGVDVERIRWIPDLESITRRFFTLEEHSQLCGLDGRDRCQAFFNCWTRKEAYIKAIGDGLSIPLNSFQVSLRPNEPATFRRLLSVSETRRSWRLCHFAPTLEYIGAVAFDGGDRTVRQWSCVSAEDFVVSGWI